MSTKNHLLPFEKSPHLPLPSPLQPTGSAVSFVFCLAPLVKCMPLKLGGGPRIRFPPDTLQTQKLPAMFPGSFPENSPPYSLTIGSSHKSQVTKSLFLTLFLQTSPPSWPKLASTRPRLTAQLHVRTGDDNLQMTPGAKLGPHPKEPKVGEWAEEADSFRRPRVLQITASAAGP